MYARIALCPAPCEGKVSSLEYRQNIDNLILALSGKADYLIEELTQKMRKKAEECAFEEAAKLRDKIFALCALSTKNIGLDILSEEEGLKEILGIKQKVRRIEAFDISNIFGKEACGSMVVFLDGLPYKQHYRRFRIKSVFGIDDYAMLREVLRRRYGSSLSQRLPVPDLIAIDGGKGHLSVACEEIASLGLKDTRVLSIAKEEENIYVAGKKIPLRLRKESAVLNLIRRVRDEAHRFAVAYHHILRRKQTLKK